MIMPKIELHTLIDKALLVIENESLSSTLQLRVNNCLSIKKPFLSIRNTYGTWYMVYCIWYIRDVHVDMVL